MFYEEFGISKEDLTPAMHQYAEIKEQYPEYLMFYRIGDFYELFFNDAQVAARALDIALTKHNKDSRVPMCGVPFHAYDSYMARLIHQGYKVAICEGRRSEAGKRTWSKIGGKT